MGSECSDCLCFDCYNEFECSCDDYDCYGCNSEDYCSCRAYFRYFFYIAFFSLSICAFIFIILFSIITYSPPISDQFKLQYFEYKEVLYSYDSNYEINKIYKAYNETQRNNIDFDIINGHLLIPIFAIFSLAFSFLFTFFKKDGLLYIISEIVSMGLKISFVVLKKKLKKKVNTLLELTYWELYNSYPYYNINYEFGQYYIKFDKYINKIIWFFSFELFAFIILLVLIYSDKRNSN